MSASRSCDWIQCVFLMAFTMGLVSNSHGSPTATAQDAASDAFSGGSELQEIVVTAEKRESTVQKTPISMTAISGDALAEKGISSVEQLVGTIPGVSMRSGGPGETEYEMRGLSSQGGSSPTVGFYLDETPMSPPANSLNGKVVIDPDLYDLSRVEVLRGPQGTLYGSGSMGGTIKLVTNSPKLNTFEGSVDTKISGTEGGGANPSVNAMVNLPLISDRAALRVVATEDYTSGWIDRVVVSPFPFPTSNGCPATAPGCNAGNVGGGPVIKDYSDVNSERLKSVRASLLIVPADKLSINIGAFWQELRMGGFSQYDASSGLAPVGGRLAHYQPADEPEGFGDTFRLFHVTVSYGFDFADLTSATAYWSRAEYQNQDVTQSTQFVLGLPDFLPTIANETDTSHQFSQEIRLTSTSPGRLQWIGGVFYERMSSTYNFSQALPSLCDLSVGGCAANPEGIAAIQHNPYTIQQNAAFGEVSFAFTDTLKLTAGARYFDFENHLNVFALGFFTPNGNATPYTPSVESRNSGVNPKVNLSYMPSGNLTLYATISKGFRPGGVNLPAPTTGPDSCLASLQNLGLNGPVLQYGPDSIWSYEVGEKARSLGGRLTINGDVYYTRWNNIQLSYDPLCGFPFTSNAGTAESYGPELEIAADLGAGLAISLSGAYTHARLVSANPTSGYVGGSKINNIPAYTESTTLSYTRPLSNAYKLKAIVTNSIVGPQEDIAYTFQQLPSYDITNVRLALEASSWTGTFFISNLANKIAALGINNTNTDFNIPDLTRVSTNQPRTYGVELQYRF